MLTAEESLEKAAAFIADNHLAAPDELTLDGVVSIRQMTVTAEEIAANKYSHTPEIVGYVVMLKRDLGDLPILTNDTDTIMVEIGPNGQVASAASNYQTGRTVEQRESIAPKFATVEAAKKGLVTLVEITRTDSFECDLSLVARANGAVTGNLVVNPIQTSDSGARLEAGFNLPDAEGNPTGQMKACCGTTSSRGYPSAGQTAIQRCPHSFSGSGACSTEASNVQ